MTMNQIHIVSAERKHIAGLYKMIEELAIYEKAREEMWMSLDDYFDAFAKAHFRAIVAVEDDAVVGTCVFYHSFSTWKGKMLYLEDFVVKESHRRHGLGHQLFNRLLAICKEEDFKLIKWQVLDWNVPAIKFYEKNGATIEKEWWNGKIIFKAPVPS